MISQLHSLDDQFKSDNNKKLLWDLLCEKPIFINKINTDVINTKNSFEYILSNINTSNYTNLIDLNKVFILEILHKCNNDDFFKINQVTNEVIVSNREKLFEERLKRRQDEFSQLINKKVPNEINFQDDITELPINNLDTLIQNTMEKRKYDIPPPVDVNEKKVTFDLLNNDDVDISNDTNYIIDTNEKNDFFENKIEKIETFENKIETFENKIETFENKIDENDFFEQKNEKNEKKNVFEEKMLEKMDEILQKLQKIIDTRVIKDKGE